MSDLGGPTTADAHVRPWILRRPRLLKRIEESSAAIVVLFGPAGYGKTTLGRQFADAHVVAWHTCRPSSVDVAKLARGISVAFRAAIGSDVSTLEERLLVTLKPDAEAEVLANLVVDAVATTSASEAAWLVIDDYQLLMENLAAEEFVATLASAETFRTLITTRVRPRWASARSRLYGDCFEIDTRELAMTQEEVAEVFRRVNRPAPAQAVAIADGWPAIVSLFALTGAAEPAVLSGAVEEFLASEVYSGLDHGVRNTLTILAALPTSDRATAAGIVGEAELSDAISAGEKTGILIAEADGRLELHPLIAELLRDSRRANQDDLAPAFDRAARLYLTSRQWDEAFEVIELLGDRQLFETLLSEALRPSLKQGRTMGVKRWIAFARQADWQIPSVDLAAAEIALRDGLYIRAESLSAALAERATSATERTWSRLVAGRAAHLAGKEEAALTHYRLARQSAGNTDEARVAAWGELTSATDLELPEVPELLAELEMSQVANADDQLQLACRRLSAATRFGTLHVLEDVLEAGQLLPFVEDPLLRTSFLNQVAYVAALSGEYTLALRTLEQMLDDAERYRIPFVVPYAQFARAVVLVARREFRHAFDLLKLARDEGQRTNDAFVVASCAAIRARALISLGAHDEAAAAATYHSGRLIKAMRAELCVTRALATACLGASDDAIGLVREARRLSRTVEVPVTAACVETIVGSHADGKASVLASHAAQLARDTRYVDGLISAYRGYPELARLIATHPEHRLWLADVMSSACDHELIRVVGLSRKGEAASHLSPREAEVFHLLRKGQSNKQIAHGLYISEATVKIHVRHICEKLGVRTRTEAALKMPPEGLGDLN